MKKIGTVQRVALGGKHRIKLALGVAFVVGLTAALTWGIGRRAEVRHPPKGRFVTVNGVRLHYVEYGTGPVAILFHGNGATLEESLASGVVERVARSHRIIIFDRPGYGYSARPRRRLWTPAAQAELFFEACKALGVERATVVGHSWGTLVALALALQKPQFVRGLVLLSGYYFPTARLDAVLSSPPALPILGDILRYTLSPLLGRLFARPIIAKLFAPQKIPQRFRNTYSIGIGLRPWQIRASAEEAALMVPAVIGLRDKYQTLQVPLVLFAGGGDTMTNVQKQSVRLHSVLPQSELHVLPNLGHMVHHFAPDRVAAAIEAFGYA